MKLDDYIKLQNIETEEMIWSNITKKKIYIKIQVAI